jgi:hypothetical protein
MQRRMARVLARVAMAGGLAAGGLVLAGTGVASAAPIQAGDVLVCRVGAVGNAGLSSAGTAAFIDEYTPAGTLVQSIAVPTTANGSNKPLVLSGTATSDCQLSLSTDGTRVVFTGYSAAVGTASVASTSPATNPRTIALLAADGSIDTTTALTDAGGTNNSRAATYDAALGRLYWAGQGGLRYASVGASTSTDLAPSTANLRQVSIFPNATGTGNQLYVSSSSGSTRVATAGTTYPPTNPATVTNLTGAPTSPYAFFLTRLQSGPGGPDTLYVADDTTNTIQKYAFVGGSWTAAGSVNASGARGLTGSVGADGVRLYATTGGNGATGGGTLSTFLDTTGFNGSVSGTATTVATAATNTAFRGVALAPVLQSNPIVPDAKWAVLLPGSAVVLIGAVLILRRRTPVAA